MFPTNSAFFHLKWSELFSSEAWNHKCKKQNFMHQMTSECSRVFMLWLPSFSKPMWIQGLAFLYVPSATSTLVRIGVVQSDWWVYIGLQQHHCKRNVLMIPWSHYAPVEIIDATIIIRQMIIESQTLILLSRHSKSLKEWSYSRENNCVDSGKLIHCTKILI